MSANGCEEGEEYYLKVESQAKQKKELSMNDRFHDGYLKGLIAISEGLKKKSEKKRRQGSLKGRTANGKISVHPQILPN